METAVVILAAFSGGLGGAVLQPVVQYVVDRRKNSDERIAARRRNIQRMLLVHLAFGRKVATSATSIAAYKDVGKPFPLSKEDILDVIKTPDPLPPWEVERIDDEQLQTAARSFEDVVFSLTPDVLFDEDVTAESLKIRAEHLTVLSKEIIERLDALAWPVLEEAN